MKSCGNDILKEVIEKYGPFQQIVLQRVHFHIKSAFRGGSVQLCSSYSDVLFLSQGNLF